MIRLDLSLVLAYTIAEPGCDFVFNIHAANTPQQRVSDEALTHEPGRRRGASRPIRSPPTAI